MKKIYLLLGLTIILFNSCSTTKTSTASVAARIPPQFSYLPPTKSSVASTDLTIAIIQPEFVNLSPQDYVDPFPAMASSMANDFNQLLTAKGFKVLGTTYENVSAMTYTEQQTTDFCFKVQILTTPQITENPPKLHVGFGTLIPSYYTTSGQIYFAGKFHIAAYSPHNILLWQKDMNVEPTTVDYTGTAHWSIVPTGPGDLGQQMKTDNSFYNLVTQKLENLYAKEMELAWRQIDPEEMKIVAKQAKEADKKFN